MLWWGWSLSTFSKFARLLKWATFGPVCLQYKAFGGPKTGTLSQILRRSNYSWLFWLVKHKLMKCKYFSFKWYTTKKFIQNKYFGHRIPSSSSTWTKLWVQLVFTFFCDVRKFNHLLKEAFYVLSIAPEIRLIDISWTCDDHVILKFVNTLRTNNFTHKIFVEDLYDKY